MILNKIKTYAGIIVAAIIGVLYLLLGKEKAEKKQAETERDIQRSKADFEEKKVERHEQRQKIEDNNALGDEPHIDDGLSKYYRD